jgi:hypothetical protein
MAKNKITFEEFSVRVENAYNGRISVVKESYVDTRHPVTAYCNIHKIYFKVKKAYDLIKRNVNCPECHKESIQNKSIKDWNDVYKSFIETYNNKFSYDKTTYKGTKQLMKVH